MLQTLGDVVMCGLAIAAVVLVPAGIIRAWWPEVSARIGGVIMSRPQSAPPISPDMEAVCIPVWDTGMDGHTIASGDDIMPRIGRELTDTELITVLAVQRKGGAYRSSANQIATYVGGDRNTVLALIREIRAERPAPVYPERPHPLEKFKAVNEN